MKTEDVEKKVYAVIDAANKSIDKNYKGYVCKIKVERVQFNEWKKKEGETRVYINVVLRYDVSALSGNWWWDRYRKFNCGYLKNGRYYRPKHYSSAGILYDLAITDKEGSTERILESVILILDKVISERSEKEDSDNE